jgi:archaellum component FlaD/FlaE
MKEKGEEAQEIFDKLKEDETKEKINEEEKEIEKIMEEAKEKSNETIVYENENFNIKDEESIKKLVQKIKKKRTKENALEVKKRTNSIAPWSSIPTPSIVDVIPLFGKPCFPTDVTIRPMIPKYLNILQDQTGDKGISTNSLKKSGWIV